ncbi:hypothetical protein BDB01DRAFT_43159 [Pilobolus umbonatus]|nr:hypothetical protein BDB01DRAFT_43159 [Pilobolus umbonatus]
MKKLTCETIKYKEMMRKEEDSDGQWIIWLFLLSPTLPHSTQPKPPKSTYRRTPFLADILFWCKKYGTFIQRSAGRT